MLSGNSWVVVWFLDGQSRFMWPRKTEARACSRLGRSPNNLYLWIEYQKDRMHAGRLVKRSRRLVRGRRVFLRGHQCTRSRSEQERSQVNFPRRPHKLCWYSSAFGAPKEVAFVRHHGQMEAQPLNFSYSKWFRLSSDFNFSIKDLLLGSMIFPTRWFGPKGPLYSRVGVGNFQKPGRDYSPGSPMQEVMP